MSLTAHLLFNWKTRLPNGGTATHYRPEDYIDAKRPTMPVIKVQKETCFAHLVNKKVENSDAIIEALRAGHKTQKEITAATRLCKATVWNHLVRLVGSEDVHIDTSKKPWTYQLVEDEQ